MRAPEGREETGGGVTLPSEDGGELYRSILDELYEGVYLVDSDRRITYWNRGAERITGYPAAEVVGIHCWDGVLMHLDAEGKPLCDTGACLALSSMRSGAPVDSEAYLLHRDGHRVPVATHSAPIFNNGTVTGVVETFSDNRSVEEARAKIEELERLALLDELTGLGNRRHAEVHLKARLDQLERYGWPFGVLYFDIDRFKEVNDTYGHSVGDRVLIMVARTTEGALRSFDIVSRWGGEEFTAIIENVREDLLSGIAEKLRSLVEQSALNMGGTSIRATVSVGATPARGGDTIEGLVDRADRLMYSSKKSGRNRVTVG